MYLLLLGFLSVLVFLAIAWFVKYRQYYVYMKNVPGPTPLPILGNALNYKSTKEIFTTGVRYMNQYGALCKVMIGFKTIIRIAEHDFLQFFLSSTKIISKSQEYIFFKSWLAEGLLTSKGTKWTKRRKLLTPSFHFQILKQFVDVFNSSGDVLVQKLKKEVGKESTDVYKYITLCTLDVICESTMGILINAQENENCAYVKSVKEMGRIIMDRTLNPLKHVDLLYVFSRDFWKERRALKVIHGMTDSVIRKRREHWAQIKNTEKDIGEYKKRMAFLDILLQAKYDGKPISDADIREEVDTFLFEGHDTTASGISFALYNISIYPEIQKNIVKELRETLGDDKQRPMTSNDIRSLKYLEMVIKESLRLFPPVPVIARKLENNVEHNGISLPKNLSVLISTFLTHRNPDLFPNPYNFDPERFTPENRNKNYPYSYIPFSAGPRNCIGQKFAMMEMKSIISNVLRNYELLPVENYEPVLLSELTLKSANGILVRFKA